MDFIRIFKNIALSALSVFVSLLLLEGALRIFSPIKFQWLMYDTTKTWVHDKDNFNVSTFRISRDLGFEPIPHAIIGSNIRINSLGMFDKERLAAKADGVYRIICVGDSTTANSEYVPILEQMLNQESNSLKFEVWNCGVPGYGMPQYYRGLKEKWLNYNPDLVIIGFCLNDFVTTPVFIRENNELVGYFPYREIFPRLSPYLMKNSALYRFLAVKLLSLKNTHDYQERFDFASRQLKDLKEELSRKKIKFILVILGLPQEYDRYPEYFKESYVVVKKIAEGSALESIDTVPIFKSNNPKSLKLTSADEIHFNKQASFLVSSAINSYLKQKGISK
jgi:hypothetical protein